MEEEWVAYKYLHTAAEIEDEKAYLDEKSIPYKVENSSLHFDPSFSNNPLYKGSTIKIPQSYLKKVQEKDELSHEEKYKFLSEQNHYLLEFEESELLEILRHKDEWSPEDYYNAITLLKIKYNRSYKDDELNEIEKLRIEDLEKGQEGNNLWIFSGYLLAVITIFFGLAIGFNYLLLNKRMPDGRKVPHYDEATQKHGKNIIILAIFTIFLGAIIRYLKFKIQS